MLIRMASYKSSGQLMAAPVNLDILKVMGVKKTLCLVELVF